MLYFLIFILISFSNENSLINKANNLIKEAKYKEALEPLNIILKEEPNNSLALNLIGTVYQSINEIDKAEKFFFKSLSSDIKNNEARLNLAAIAFLKGHTNKALILYNDVLVHDKENIKALESLAIIMLSLNKYDDAKVFYNRIIVLDKNRPALNLGLGVIALNKLEIKEARAYFLKELEIDNKNIDAMFNLALAYEYDLKGTRYANNLDYTNAIKYYKKLLEEDPNFSLASLHLAIVYAKNKNYKEAIRITEREVEKNIKIKDKIYYNLACFYSLYNDTENALKYLKLSIKNGFKDFEKIKKDPDLDHIKNTAEFKKLVK